MKSRRRVLLVSYFFPPRQAVGSLRPSYLARYLPSEGWDVTVLTADLQGEEPPLWSQVVETPYTDVVANAKRLIGLSPNQSTYAAFGQSVPKLGGSQTTTTRQRLIRSCWNLITYPDPQRGWYRHLVTALSGLLATGAYDAVISSAPPVSMHMAVAKALRGRKPWVADLRDAWAGNPYYPGRVRHFFDRLLESRTLARASAITVNAKPVADTIACDHPTIRVFSVLNAFDPAEWDGVPFVTPRKCTLTYAGRQLRDPSVLFRALALELNSGAIDRTLVEVNLYTFPSPWLESDIQEYGLSDVVRLRGLVSRSSVLHAERSSTANISLLTSLPGEEDIYPGKVLEYLGAGRPIFAVGPPKSVVRDLVHQGFGSYASSVDETRSALRSIYAKWIQEPDYVIKPELVEQYSAPMLARRFAQILDQIFAY
jgi:hypothetical protein